MPALLLMASGPVLVTQTTCLAALSGGRRNIENGMIQYLVELGEALGKDLEWWGGVDPVEALAHI